MSRHRGNRCRRFGPDCGYVPARRVTVAFAHEPSLTWHDGVLLGPMQAEPPGRCTYVAGRCTYVARFARSGAQGWRGSMEVPERLLWLGVTVRDVLGEWAQYIHVVDDDAPLDGFYRTDVRRVPRDQARQRSLQRSEPRH